MSYFIKKQNIRELQSTKSGLFDLKIKSLAKYKDRYKLKNNPVPATVGRRRGQGKTIREKEKLNERNYF